MEEDSWIRFKKRRKEYIVMVITSVAIAFLINLLSSTIGILYLENLPTEGLYKCLLLTIIFTCLLSVVLGYFIIPAFFKSKEFLAVYIINRRNNRIMATGSYALFSDELRRRVGDKILDEQFDVSRLRDEERRKIEEKIESLTIGVLIEWLSHEVREIEAPLSTAGYFKLMPLPTRYLRRGLSSLREIRDRKEIDFVEPWSIETDNPYVYQNTPIELPKGMKISKIGKNRIVIEGKNLQVKISVACVGIIKTPTQITSPFFRIISLIIGKNYGFNIEDLFDVYVNVMFEAKTTGLLSRFRVKPLYLKWVEEVYYSLKDFINWDDQIKQLAISVGKFF